MTYKEALTIKTDKLSYIVLALLTLALPPSAFASTTGKIAGRVIDAQGEPLGGASVVIEGTNRGAIVNTDGFYAILPVEPGVYTLTAKELVTGVRTSAKVKVEAGRRMVN